MQKRLFLLFLSLLLPGLFTLAQDKAYAKKVITDLCSPAMSGRGYVNDGVNKAADYIAQEFEKLGVQKFGDSYFQSFQMPINTFPQDIVCTLDNAALQEGRHFLMRPNSGDCNGRYTLSHFNLADEMDSILYEKKRLIGLLENEAIVIQHPPKGFQPMDATIHISSTDQKIIHSLAPTADDKCRLIFPDSIIHNAGTLTIKAKHQLIPDFTTKNVIGYLPAKKRRNRNNYLVFTAHYDHLGKMGEAMFPGASDNASGTAMVLNLAKHFQQRNNDYSIVFMLFAGEEAGLLGSEYYTEHPIFPIEQIKMLVNLDIMGSVENGIVVVNATEFPKQFQRLKNINKAKKHLPEVRPRGPTRNSDHYHFYKKGIPSFFIYSNGGPGFYHDIDDTPESLPMSNYENVFKLLVDFVGTF